MTSRTRSGFGAVVTLALVVTGPALAQTGADPQTQSLVDEIERMVDKGERERLADPGYLRDLRAVLSRYGQPERRRILEDDFSARGPAPAAPWRVLAGEFVIDWRHGLRAVVAGPGTAPAPAPDTESKRTSNKDVAAALIGAILQQAVSGESGSGGSGADTQAPADRGVAPAPGQPASVVAQVAIPNAFALTVEFTARPLAGVTNPRLEIGPYQGASTESGYRLIHQGGASPSFTLVSASGRHATTVDLVDRAIDLRDGAPHTLKWIRDRQGRMRISLDGERLMDVTDRRFRDAFDGLVVVNAGGDFALRQITIHGGG